MTTSRESLAISVGCVLDATRGAKLDDTSAAARERLQDWFMDWERPSKTGLAGIMKDRDRLLAAVATRPPLKRGDIVFIGHDKCLYVGDTDCGVRWACLVARKHNFKAMCDDFDSRFEKK